MSEVITTLELSGGMLVGHDGSPASAEAVRWAARLAERLDCKLHVIRTWSLSSAPRPASATGGYVPPMADFEAAVVDRL
ncbi:MAG: universal stress protein, partial [Nocardioides sp.]